MYTDTIRTHHNLFLIGGALALVASIAILRAVPDESPLLWVGAILSVASGLSLALGVFGTIHSRQPVDERFILHRLKSTRFALVLGMVALGALLIFHAVADNEVRYDLLTIMSTMAVGKLGGVAYFKLRQ